MHSALGSGVPAVAADGCGALNAKRCQQEKACIWHQNACERQPAQPPHDRPFPRTCNNGHTWEECFDVEACAAGAPGPTPDAKWAIVFTHTNSQEWPFRGVHEDTMGPLRRLANRLGNTDILLMLPEEGAVTGYDDRGEPWKTMPLRADMQRKLRALGVKVKTVPWALPPGMRFVVKDNKEWCGGMDFVRLHILGLKGYAAVAYYDTDMRLTGRGDPAAPLRCAAKGHFLATGGPLSPLNIGFFAVKPMPGLMEAAVHFARAADFDMETGSGWGGAGIAPMKMEFPGRQLAKEFGYPGYPGSWCGQGFLHTLFYKQTAAVAEAFRHAGIERPRAQHLDRCVWNFMGEKGCHEQEKDFDCNRIVMFHKNGQWCKLPKVGRW